MAKGLYLLPKYTVLSAFVYVRVRIIIVACSYCGIIVVACLACITAQSSRQWKFHLMTFSSLDEVNAHFRFLAAQYGRLGQASQAI